MTETEKESINATQVYTIYKAKGWNVVKYRSDDDGSILIACGAELPTASGIHATLYGEWTNSVTYGRQFNVSYFNEILPVDETGIVSYLCSLKVGIGKTRAKNIYKQLGSKVWDILENKPEALVTEYKIRGVTPAIMEKLANKLKETQSMRHIMNLFRGRCGISPDRAKKISDAFGDKSEIVITRKPYMLCSLGGFTFPDVDEFALSNGLPCNSKDRLLSALDFLFEEESTRGNVCIEKDEICPKLLEIVNKRGEKLSISMCEKAVNAAYAEKRIAAARAGSKFYFFTKQKFEEERSIAKSILGMLSNESLVDDLEPFINQYQKETGVSLAEKQADGVRMVMKNSFSVLTGGPGTGKTTTIKAILYVHKLVYGNSHKPVLLAPTGKAARRMSEATGYPACTIHSAIQYVVSSSGEGALATEDPLDGNLIIVDESSMVDQMIAYMLLKKIPEGARLVLVGDPDQLPSVGCGNILLDLIDSHVVPVTKLNVIYRQGADSPIITNAHRINEGNVNLDYSNRSFKFMPCPSYEYTFKLACEFYLRCVKAYGLDNTILLCPYRAKSELNVNMFNKKLQEKINPAKPNEEVIKSHGIEFRIGDRIMQLKNTDAAKNGDTGYILNIEKAIDKSDPTEYALYATVEFNGDGNEITYAVEDFKNVDLAYCTTVHKSQGSEYKTVLMIVSNANPVMLKRNVVYTGVTRAKENVALIGEESALKKAILNGTSDVRNTLLKERLIAGVQKESN